LGEFEDAALMKVMAADGKGFIALPSVVLAEALQRYGFRAIGATEKCRAQFYAISAERRITHPAVRVITEGVSGNPLHRLRNKAGIARRTETESGGGSRSAAPVRPGDRPSPG
jgi:hypothetical protein